MTDHVARTARTEALIAQLLEVVHELELMHPGRKFPLDGHLVGSIGEAAAEALFAITLVTASTTGHDAVTDAGRKVEIKATFGTSSVSVRPTSSQHEGAALDRTEEADRGNNSTGPADHQHHSQLHRG